MGREGKGTGRAGDAIVIDLLILSFIAVAIGSCRLLLTRAVRREPVKSDDGWVVQYGWPMRSISLLMSFVAGVFIYLIVFYAEARPPIAVAAVAAVAFAAIALNLEFFGVRIIYNDRGIRSRSPWRRARYISWEAIRTLTYSPIFERYIITTDGHGKIRLQNYLAGRAWLIEELENRGVVVSGVERPLVP